MWAGLVVFRSENYYIFFPICTNLLLLLVVVAEQLGPGFAGWMKRAWEGKELVYGTGHGFACWMKRVWEGKELVYVSSQTTRA